MDIEKAYINEISNTPLLKVEEERELAVKIQQGDLDAREQLITANLRLVVKIAHDYKILVCQLWTSLPKAISA